MSTIERNPPPSNTELESFSKQVSFCLPAGFLDFYQTSNGAEIIGEENYTTLWPLNDLFALNKSYDVEQYAPEFFISGSDGGDTAYAIEKQTGNIFEMPFIGMSKKEAHLVARSFMDFVKKRMEI